MYVEVENKCLEQKLYIHSYILHIQLYTIAYIRGVGRCFNMVGEGGGGGGQGHLFFFLCV